MEKGALDFAPDVKYAGAEAATSKEGLTALRPSDVIERYYGPELSREVAKAALANERSKALKGDLPFRILDRVPVVRDPDVPEKPHYLPDRREIHMPNAEALDIAEKNVTTRKGWMAGQDPSLKARLEERARLNSYASVDELNATDWPSVLEHETGHHFTQAASGEGSWADQTRRYLYDAGMSEHHLSDPDELTQAAGRLQRELFKGSGKRIENPKKFLDLVQSGQTPDYLTKEGKRLLVFTRELMTPKEGESNVRSNARKAAAKRIAEMLPSVVSADTGDSFREAIESRTGTS